MSALSRPKDKTHVRGENPSSGLACKEKRKHTKLKNSSKSKWGSKILSRLGITEHPQQLYTAFEGLCMEFVHFDKFHGLEIDLELADVTMGSTQYIPATSTYPIVIVKLVKSNLISGRK